MIHIKAGENTGGREAIHRLIAAYNFRSRQQLCDHLGVNKSTMANRYLRDSFPAEWIIQCALETSASLLWLATGEGNPEIKISQKQINQISNVDIEKQNSPINFTKVDKSTLISGKLFSDGIAALDCSLLPQHTKGVSLLHTDTESYIISQAIETISNGYFLVSIDEVLSIVKITRLPKNRLIIEQNKTSFECDLDDIEIKGRAIKVFKSL
ncbi:phage repressor protein CI [Rosenbergiella nectarea]|uniref:phage repressor protein CI n=1 Tax=Rosenbergiella nectarea TaxID=988801 RepID=UPI001F4E87E2|nr:phage repressor protein CI [Rosenbergiella nectarea]